MPQKKLMLPITGLEGGGGGGGTKYATAVEVTIDSTSCHLFVQLKDKYGDNLGPEQSVNLSLASQQVVSSTTDLTSSAVWEERDTQLFNGMLVVVTGDTAANDGIYRLKNSSNFEDIKSWEKITETSELTAAVEELRQEISDANPVIELATCPGTLTEEQLNDAKEYKNCLIILGSNVYRLARIADDTYYYSSVSATAGAAITVKELSLDITTGNYALVDIIDPAAQQEVIEALSGDVSDIQEALATKVSADSTLITDKNYRLNLSIE